LQWLARFQSFFVEAWMSLSIRRLLFTAALALAPLAIPAGAQAQEKALRIGFQKFGELILLKSRGTLEKKAAALGYKVTWIEFPAGPQLLEALNVGAIDFGNAGEAPPIFAQAAGAPFVYVGYEPATPRGEAILVPKDSPIKTLADLKGKKIALNKGSNVHFLLAKALEKAGVAYSEVQPTYLTPADARAAFERGAVDAWVIWDPFLAAAETATGARTLADGTGLVSNYQFYLSTRTFAVENLKAVQLVLDELREVDHWIQTDPKAAAAQLSGPTGIPASILEVALARQSYGTAPLSEEAVKSQQTVADTFYALGLLPKPVRVADAVWRARS
jgi:sulfonate transport system substrate-binding protein